MQQISFMELTKFVGKNSLFISNTRIRRKHEEEFLIFTSTLIPIAMHGQTWIVMTPSRQLFNVFYLFCCVKIEPRMKSSAERLFACQVCHRWVRCHSLAS